MIIYRRVDLHQLVQGRGQSKHLSLNRWHFHRWITLPSAASD